MTNDTNDLPPGQSRPSRLRDWFWTPVTPVLNWCFQSMPVSWLEPLASAGAAVWSRRSREREILRRNLDRILGVDIETPEGAEMAANIYRNQIICAMEAMRAIHRPELVKIEGLWEMGRVLQAAESQGRGVLVVTGHLGSWEMIELFAPRLLDNRFYELAKPTRIKAFTRLLEKLRLRAGTHVVWNDQKMLLRTMLRILRGGHTLGLACDQKPKQLLGPVVDFFGRPTEFVGGPGVVAQRSGCAVVAVFCTRLAPFTYRLTTEPLLPASKEPREADAITQRIAHSIEGAVRRWPEQWPWTYRRWIYEDDDWSSPRGRPGTRGEDRQDPRAAAGVGDAAFRERVGRPA